MAALEKAVEELIPTLRFAAQGFLPGRLLGDEYSTATSPQLVPIPKAIGCNIWWVRQSFSSYTPSGN